MHIVHSITEGSEFAVPEPIRAPLSRVEYSWFITWYRSTSHRWMSPLMNINDFHVTSQTNQRWALSLRQFTDQCSLTVRQCSTIHCDYQGTPWLTPIGLVECSSTPNASPDQHCSTLPVLSPFKCRQWKSLQHFRASCNLKAIPSSCRQRWASGVLKYNLREWYHS